MWLAKIVRDGMRRETTLGTADDVLDPDGVLAIGYPQAQAKAREWFEAVARPATHARPYTVREAAADYLDWFRATGRKSIKETEASVNAFILPRLGDEEVATLTGLADEEVRESALRGQIAWIDWTGGNDRFWDYAARNTAGAFDLNRMHTSPHFMLGAKVMRITTILGTGKHVALF